MYRSVSKQEDDPLSKINQDYVCWLNMEEMKIDLPVVMGVDDAYYLEHAFDGSQSGQGTPFFSAGTTMNDAVRIIYGHHVLYDETAMFSPLLHIADANKEITFTLKYPQYQENYQITHVFDLPKNDQTFLRQKQQFHSKEEFSTWIAYAEQHNQYKTRSVCSEKDAYVLLQTCGNEADQFLIVIGRKINA